MAPRNLKEYQLVVDEHRRRLARLSNRRGIASMKKLYDDAQAQVAAKLKASLRAHLGDTFTAHMHRIVLIQLRQGQAMLAARLSGELGAASKEAQVESLRALSGDVARLEKKFTGAPVTLPVEEAARFKGVIDKRRTSLLKMHQESMARYGANVVKAMEDTMAKGLLTEAPTGEVIDSIQEVAGGEWWQAERIVRTETAWAYNATQYDGLIEAAEELPDIQLRWSEHVDDETGQPLDDRVSVDSLAMHGQVAVIGGSFTMPASSPAPDKDGNTEVPDGLIGKTWSFPPNRPNDRAVLAPWRPHWGIPGWQLRGGRRVRV